MGLYDRDYSRPEPTAFGSRAFGQSMVVTIIAINGAIFLANLFIGHDDWLTDHLAASGESLVKPWLWWQLLTSGFVHDPRDIWHLVFNMLGLWFLGRFVEDWLGKWEFLRFYLVAIVVGSVVHAARICVFVDPQWWSLATLVGASGAVTAVIILFVCRFPQVKLLLFFVLPVPAWLIGIIIVVQDALGNGGIYLNPFGDNQAAARVAYDVHLSGAAFAVIYYFSGMNLGRWLPHWLGEKFASVARGVSSRPNLRVHTPVVEEEDDTQYRDLDEEADRLLAKINTHGEASLTAAERRVLEDYSRRMRQKYR